MKINQVDLCVKDLEESVKFYCDAFGFEKKMVRETGMGMTAALERDDFKLTLMTSPKLPIGIVSLGCSADGDIDGTVEELKSHGAKVVMEPSAVGLGKIAKVWDPNDISIYVMDVNNDAEDSGARVTHMPNKINTEK